MDGVVTTADQPTSRAGTIPEAKICTSLDLCSLHAELQQAVFVHHNKKDVFVGLTDFLRRLLNAVVVAGFERDTTGTLICAHFSSMEQGGSIPANARLLQQWAESVCEQRRTQIDRLGSEYVVICTPIGSDEQPVEALVVVLLLGAEPIEPFVVISQLAAGYLTSWQIIHKTHELEWEAKSAAAILDIVGKLSENTDLTMVSHTLVSELQSHLCCDRVAIGFRRGEGGSCRLVAVSGIADLDPRSDVVRSMEAALNESVLRNTVTVWPPPDEQDRDAAISHRKLGSLMNSGGILSAPLRIAEGAVFGAWIFLGSEDFKNQPHNRHFIEACSPPVAAILRILQQFQSGLLRRSAQRMFRALPLFRGKALWALLAALAMALFIPAPYKVSVECEIQPVVRRFVAAPFAGEFEKSFVKPGDLVVRGQVMGRMEGRDVRWELAGLTADQQRARKSCDANIVAEKTAAAQMDQLEMERLEVKRKLFENRLQQLEIRSPIGGIVISGDLERSEGVPVTVGQVLFEVAPLEGMVGELAIPDEEISHVVAGMPVTLWLNAYPGVMWEGSVRKFHPRSVTREKDNVFLGEVTLDNHDLTLRPGMKGHAKIRTANHTLGWIIFHKPWNYVASWLGW
jgi:biotin carboxyl carrier protein